MPDSPEDSQTAQPSELSSVEKDQDQQASEKRSSDSHDFDSHSSKQSDDSKSDNLSTNNQADEEAPPMNLFEATGVALFKSAEASTINRPRRGELKRSLRLARLLIIVTLGILGLIIVLGLLVRSLPGSLKLIGILVFLTFTVRCGYVAYGLWRKLQ